MQTAWDMIGFDGTAGQVRVVGGRTLYEAVSYRDDTPGTQVRLSRLVFDTPGKLRQIDRYVDPDTPMEVVLDG